MRNLELFWRDLKHAERSLLKHPGFSMVAVSLIALAICSNLAVFSIVDPLSLAQMPPDFTPTSPVYFWIDIYARKTPAASVQQIEARMTSAEASTVKITRALRDRIITVGPLEASR